MASRDQAAAGLDMTAALAEVARRFQERGVRFTPQRRAVAETVLGSDQPVSAQQIHDAARRIRSDLGLMTVYRTLDLLDDAGVVRRIYGDQHCEAFVAAGHRHGHAVVCTLCGRAEEFTHCHIEALAAAAAEETGFAIDDHFLQFSGICRDCQLKRRNAAGGMPADRREGGRDRSGETMRRKT